MVARMQLTAQLFHGFPRSLFVSVRAFVPFVLIPPSSPFGFRHLDLIRIDRLRRLNTARFGFEVFEIPGTFRVPGPKARAGRPCHGVIQRPHFGFRRSLRSCFFERSTARTSRGTAIHGRAAHATVPHVADLSVHEIPDQLVRLGRAPARDQVVARHGRVAVGADGDVVEVLAYRQGRPGPCPEYGSTSLTAGRGGEGIKGIANSV
jgi:hypothetical protein